MSHPTTHEMTTEEKLAAIAALMNGNESQVVDKPKSFACPIDPAERAMCEGCQ